MMRALKPCLALASAICIIGCPVSAFAAEIHQDATSAASACETNANDLRLEFVEDDGRPYDEIVIQSNPLFRASGTYKSTYDMTGGIYTRQSWEVSSAPTFKVTISPTYFAGSDDRVEMGVFLERKELFGWSTAAEGRVTVMKGGTVTLRGASAGTYRIYLRNWSGFSTKGNISITYSY